MLSNLNNQTMSTTPKKSQGHSKALPVTVDMNQPGRLRIGHLLTIYAVSHSSFYSHVKAGLIPQADGKDGGRPWWKTSTIRDHLNS